MSDLVPEKPAGGHPVILGPGDALLIVDLQNCFLPGGSLGVAGGDRVIAPLNRIADLFRGKGLTVFLSRDWHPPDHISFRSRGGPWPSHCVRNTDGAQFSPALKIPPGAMVFSKGMDSEHEEYSAWRARNAEGLTLHDVIRNLSVRRVFIGGLTTEYCVLNTVKDARAAGYEIYVLIDAVQAVNVRAGDDEGAFAEMTSAGANLILERDILP